MKNLVALIKLFLLVSILVSCNAFASHAQGLEKVIPVENYLSTTLLPNNEVMVLSRTSLNNSYQLTKIDFSGSIVSQEEIETAHDLVELHYDPTNGGLLLVGLQVDLQYVFLRKINIDGSVIEWEQLYDHDSPTPFEVFESVKVEPVSDGSWLVVDATQNKIEDTHPEFLNVLKIDAQGNPTWKQEYHSDASDSLSMMGITIKEQSNGQFIIAGMGQSKNDSFYPFLMHIEDNGSVVDTYYGESFENFIFPNTFPHIATQTADGNFIFSKFNAQDNEVVTPFIKVSPEATLIWEQELSLYLGFANGRPMQLIPLQDGGFAFAMKYTMCEELIDPTCWSFLEIVKFDGNGEEQWRTSSQSVAILQDFGDIHLFEMTNNKILLVGKAIFSETTSTEKPLYTFLLRLENDGSFLGNQLTGTIFIDQNENCIFDEGEYTLPQQIITLSSAANNSYRTITKMTGEYTVRVAPGTYSIELDNKSELYTLDCYPNPEDLQVTFTEEVTTQTFNIALTPVVECAALNVQIGVGEIAPCDTSSYHINYCNTGTDIAENAFITLQLDPHQRIANSDINPIPLGGNQFQFRLDNIEPGRCHSFIVQIALSCKVQVGRSHCVKAQIFPRTTCIPPSTLWDESFIEVTANCENDEEVIFTITNTGTGDMMQSKTYEVYEDHVMLEMSSFQLDAGDQLQFSRQANGSTMRLEAEQSDDNPSESLPIVFVEACGLNENGDISTGIVNAVTDGDFDDFLDISCVISTASFDPNDKAVTPSGVWPQHHFVNVTDQLNYKIRFQNTGTDTAELVIIRDTLSQHLNISTFVSGISSHDYTVQFIDTNVVEFHFDPIELPDSNVNEPASHGFVEFSIYPYPTTELRTRIENNAAIYFDNNAPIITNTTFNTIGERFHTVNLVSSSHIILEDLTINISPNPIQGQAILHLNGITTLNDFSLEIFDMVGRQVQAYQNQGSSSIIIDAHDLIPGMYLYRLKQGKLTVNTGKLVVE